LVAIGAGDKRIMKKRVSIKVKTTKLSTAGGIFPLVAAILIIFSPADVHG
jgi:hypothetical protein